MGSMEREGKRDLEGNKFEGEEEEECE